MSFLLVHTDSKGRSGGCGHGHWMESALVKRWSQRISIGDVEISVVADHQVVLCRSQWVKFTRKSWDRCGVNSSTLASYQESNAQGLRGFAMTAQGG